MVLVPLPSLPSLLIQSINLAFASSFLNPLLGYVEKSVSDQLLQLWCELD